MKKKYFECPIFRNKYLDNVIRTEILKVFTIFKALITQNATPIKKSFYSLFSNFNFSIIP